jgi:heme exporter protein B
VSVVRTILVLAAKDLRIEMRTRQSIAVVLVLGVLIVAVLALGLGPGAAPGGGGGGGGGAGAVLWVAYLFGGVLCFERTMATERQDEALDGLLLAPIDRGTIFAAKLLVNLALLLGLAVVVTPVAVALFRFDLSAAPFSFARLTVLGLIGFAAVGTLFAAITSSSRLRGGLLGVLVFPVCLPLVLASSREMADRFTGVHSRGFSGEAVIVAFDVVFLAASWLMFELVLER